MSEEKILEEFYINFVWYASDIWSRCQLLTGEECKEVLIMCDKKHDAGVGMNWDFIDFWIEELYPEKFNTWHEMDWEEQEEYEERGMQE